MRMLTFYIDVKGLLRRDGQWWQSYCPALDVWSQGHSRDEARDNLIEAIQAFVESCYRRGVLEDVLREAGFEPMDAPALDDAIFITDGAFTDEEVTDLHVPLPLGSRMERVAAHAG